MSKAMMVTLAMAASTDAANMHLGRGYVGAQQQSSLLQTYDRALEGNNGVTPVTRVVNLLKEMTATLNKEMDEDEGLYKKMACWCNENVYAKKESSKMNKEKIEELQATIESLTAKSQELKTRIAELEKEVAADKAALDEASATRKQQLDEFHKMETENIAALENLKAAIVVLSKHQDGAFPQISMSLLQVKKDDESIFGADHESDKSFAFDEFLRKGNFQLGSQGLQKTETVKAPIQSHFLQSESSSTASQGLSSGDIDTVRNAMRTAAALLQARHGETYMPSYNAQSGEIFGILKQLQEEMKADLSEAQQTEADRAANFAELRKAKTSEIEAGEKMAEETEDEKAKCDNDLAEAKEDLGVTDKALEEDSKFSGNLEKTCKEAETNFNERKKSRRAEIQAVAETIEILAGDEAKDAMDTTFSFMQTGSASKERKLAAQVLRKARSPQLVLLATSVELDAFTKVKAEVDKMIEALKTQQADEVKHNDWCKSSLQENEMNTAKTQDLKADLESKAGELEATIKRLIEEIEKARADISNMQVELQRASEDRKKENPEFQRTVADQAATAEILKKALDRLATFYDEAAFAQTRAKGGNRQTPPVPQMEYSKSKGAGGVMSMIEKLIYDTKDITAKSKKTESEAQAAYEELVANTNDSVATLTKEVTEKTKVKAAAKKDLGATNDDLSDAIRELEELAKTNGDLHADCDYTMKNFMIRQKARAEEIEALQQAKQILSGANLA